MLRAVLLSGAVGMAFLIALSYATNEAAHASSAPVALIVHDVLGGVVQKLFLIFVCVSIFACGLVIMVTNGRLIFSMARDRRLPGHQLWSQVPRATGGPTWATVLAAVIGAIITLVLRTHAGALVTLFTASTIMPAILYASTVLLYLFASPAPGPRRAGTPRPSGRWEIPVIAGALIWLAYELIVLIGPSAFRDAQYYVLGALGVGLVFYVVQWLIERVGDAHRGSRSVRSGLREYPRHRPGHVGHQGAARRPRAAGARDRRGAGGHPQRRRGGGRPGGAAGVGAGGGPAGARRGRGAPADAVALANQGETVLAWDRADRPAADPGDRLAGPALGQRLRPAGRAGADELAAITGLPLDPYFAAPKMTWLRENLTADGVVTTTDTWLLARLGAGYVTDAATASRTMLLDLDARGLVGGGLRGVRPRPGRAAGRGGLRRGGRRDGGVRAGAAGGRTGRRPAGGPAGRALPGGRRGQVHLRHRRVPAGGHGPRRSGPAGAVRVGRLAAGRRGDYCLDGQVYTAGSAVSWLTGSACCAARPTWTRLGGTVPDSGGVVFVPALAGLGAPHWRPDARGAFLGLSLGTGRAHLIRAVLEGLAASVALLAGGGRAPTSARR